jgi:hypothetical protein
MRTNPLSSLLSPFLFALSSLLLWPGQPAFAQVSDAERAGARELFKAGDQLQRAGHFAEALDKFQRAQQVFSAPTNLLRIAECEAALGRLVESAEAYRVVVRTPLPAGAPPAFQAAVDQAKAELSQVEPRVPRLVVQVQPAGVQNAQMQIDGQNVPGALIGEAMSLDAGVHKVIVLAPGFESAEQQIELKEHDSKTVPFVLNPVSGVTYSAALAPPPVGPGSTVNGPMPPPPPAIVAVDLGPPPPPVSSTSLLLGLHLGAEVAGGSVPDPAGGSGLVDPSSVGSGGLAYGIDGGLRFARHWYVGLTLDHATFSGVSSTSSGSNTTLLAVVLGIIVNPQRVSFYGELGLGGRSFADHTTNASGQVSKETKNAGDISLGAGIWIPAGRFVRIIPKLSVGFSSFGNNQGDNSSDELATFGMLSVTGLYNIEL